MSSDSVPSISVDVTTVPKDAGRAPSGHNGAHTGVSVTSNATFIKEDHKVFARGRVYDLRGTLAHLFWKGQDSPKVRKRPNMELVEATSAVVARNIAMYEILRAVDDSMDVKSEDDFYTKYFSNAKISAYDARISAAKAKATGEDAKAKAEDDAIAKIVEEIESDFQPEEHSDGPQLFIADDASSGTPYDRLCKVLKADELADVATEVNLTVAEWDDHTETERAKFLVRYLGDEKFEELSDLAIDSVTEDQLKEILTPGMAAALANVKEGGTILARPFVWDSYKGKETDNARVKAMAEQIRDVFIQMAISRGETNSEAVGRLPFVGSFAAALVACDDLNSFIADMIESRTTADQKARFMELLRCNPDLVALEDKIDEIIAALEEGKDDMAFSSIISSRRKDDLKIASTEEKSQIDDDAYVNVLGGDVDNKDSTGGPDGIGGHTLQYTASKGKASIWEFRASDVVPLSSQVYLAVKHPHLFAFADALFDAVVKGKVPSCVPNMKHYCHLVIVTGLIEFSNHSLVRSQIDDKTTPTGSAMAAFGSGTAESKALVRQPILGHDAFHPISKTALHSACLIMTGRVKLSLRPGFVKCDGSVVPPAGLAVKDYFGLEDSAVDRYPPSISGTSALRLGMDAIDVTATDIEMKVTGFQSAPVKVFTALIRSTLDHPSLTRKGLNVMKDRLQIMISQCWGYIQASARLRDMFKDNRSIEAYAGRKKPYIAIGLAVGEVFASRVIVAASAAAVSVSMFGGFVMAVTSPDAVEWIGAKMIGPITTAANNALTASQAKVSIVPTSEEKKMESDAETAKARALIISNLAADPNLLKNAEDRRAVLTTVGVI